MVRMSTLDDIMQDDMCKLFPYRPWPHDAFVSQVDNIIVISDSWVNDFVEWTVSHYRKEVNDKALVVNIFLSSER